MYVREKRVRRGDKTYSYWQLVRSSWTENGPRQTVINHLGTWPDKDVAKVTAKTRGLMCAEWGCGREGSIEKTSVTADFDKRECRLLLCAEHARELESGETLTAVAFGEE